MRARGSERGRWRRLMLEGLETRALLAGNVSASLIGGTLFIRGDNAGNGVHVIQVTDGLYAVTGLDQGGDATRINGVENDTVEFSGVLNINIDSRKGDDAVAVGAEGLAIDALVEECFELDLGLDSTEGGSLEALSLVINTGDGDDVVAVIGEFLTAAIFTGNHDDSVAIGDSAFLSLVIDTGNGFDGVCIEDFDARVLSVSTGNHSDFVDISDADIGTLSIITGAAGDDVSVVNVGVDFAASVLTGGGDDFIEIFEFEIGLGLTVIAEGGLDDVNIADGDSGGSLIIQTGSDADDVAVSNIGVAGAIVVG